MTMSRDPSDALSDNFSDALYDFIKSGQTSLFIQTFQSTPTKYRVDKDGNTFLHLAVMSGAIDIIFFLLIQGYDPTKKNKNGFTPAGLAAKTTLSNKWQMVELFCAQTVAKYPSSVVVDSENNTLLHLAALSGNCSLVSYLLNKGCDPKLKNNAGLTPTITAATTSYKNKWQMVDLFVDFKQDDDPETYGFNKTLLCAVKDNNYYMAKKLLENGAKPKAVFVDTGNGCLHEAINNKNTAMIELLLQYHADMNLKNNKKVTPVRLASFLARKQPQHSNIYLSILNYESKRCHGTNATIKFQQLKDSFRESLTDYCSAWFSYDGQWVHHQERANSFLTRLNKLKTTDEIIKLLNDELVLFQYKTLKSDIGLPKYRQIPKNHNRDGFNRLLEDYLELFERLKAREILQTPIQRVRVLQGVPLEPEEKEASREDSGKSSEFKEFKENNGSQRQIGMPDFTLFGGSVPKSIQLKNQSNKPEEKKLIKKA